MTASKTRTSRRAFLAHGGAVLGTGVAATAGAAVLKSDGARSPNDELEQLRGQVARAEDREAIRQLHLSFTSLIGEQLYEAAAELFEEGARLQLGGVSAIGRGSIRELLAQQLRGQTAGAFHSAYRQNARHAQDAMAISEDRLHAAATFHVEAELSTPLQGESTIAQMARLQGHVRTAAGKRVVSKRNT